MKLKKQTHRKKYHIFIIIFCITLFIYCYLTYINITSPIIAAKEGYIDATNIKDMSKPYMLTGQWLRYKGFYTPEELLKQEGDFVHDIRYIRKMRGYTYVFSISVNEEDNLYFMLPRPNKSSMWINGQEVIGENGTSISSSDHFRLNSYHGDKIYNFVLQVSSDTPYDAYQGIFIGSKETLSMTRDIWIQLDLLAIGLSLMLILFCLVLYYYKRSEVYLPMLALSSYSELMHFFLIPRFPIMRVLKLGTVVFYGQFTFVNYFICKQFVPNIAPKWMDRMVYSLMTLSVIGCILLPSYSSAIMGYSYKLYMLLQLWILYKGVLIGIPEATIILLGCSIAIGTEIFYALLNIGIIPQGVIDVQIMPAQYFRFAYIVAFVVATCMKFAGKFVEADNLAANLEQKVNDQTKELSASKECIITVQKKKQQFMTDVVHNLRSPLFALGGYIDLIRDGLKNPTEEQEKYIDLIDKKVEYVSHMVDDMFFIYRMEDGKIKFHFSEFEISFFLEGVLQDAKAKIVNKEVQIICLCVSETINVIGDPFRLRQALDNILDNAIRYSPTDGSITIHCIKDNADNIKISVIDKGPGISLEKQSCLFERYISKGNGGHAGLGLSISKAIVLEHHGDIVVESELGKGSTFTIILPINHLSD